MLKTCFSIIIMECIDVSSCHMSQTNKISLRNQIAAVCIFNFIENIDMSLQYVIQLDFYFFFFWENKDVI
jgi:hypothetical protein